MGRRIFIDFKHLDKRIRPAVEVLWKAGFKTVESCQGGKGHAYKEPTIRFEGDELEMLRAYKVCKEANLRVYAAKRVYDPEICKRLFNEIIFYYGKNGSIFFQKN